MEPGLVQALYSSFWSGFFPLSREKTAFKAGNYGGCCGERFFSHPAPSSVTANPLFPGMPVTKLLFLPVPTLCDPVGAEALRDSDI